MAENPIVKVQQGSLKGKTGKDINGGTYYSFQGIPYAKPPLGNLRFKAPQPPESWEGVRDATKEGSGCFSREMFERKLVGSEDCLFLNVYTPELPTEKEHKLKPTMLWIHGGAFTRGSGSSLMYGPQFLMTKDVVVVTINYRLGLLGFLSFEDSATGIPGNAGLKDQVMALRWVKENIKNFNGDPDNVTIFGESAGAMSVHYLVLSPMAKGLFHKAISQSGTALVPWAYGSRIGKTIAKMLGSEATTDKEIAEFLQGVPVDKLYGAQEELGEEFGIDEIREVGPVVEKPFNEPAFISEEPIDIIKSGNFNKVPYLLGYNSREGMIAAIYAHKGAETVEFMTDFEQAIPFTFNVPKGSDLSKKMAQKIKNFYYGDQEPSKKNIQKYYFLQTDTFFVWFIQNTIKRHFEHSTSPMYFYRFSVDTALNESKIYESIKIPGVSHGDDVCYIFKNYFTPEITPSSIEDLSYKRVSTLWTNFARTGNPNPAQKDSLIPVKWLPVESEALNYLSIGENLTIGTNPEAERMHFWDELSKLTS